MSVILDPESFENRRKSFQEEYAKLVEKYRVDFIAVLGQSQTSIQARLAIADLKQTGEESKITN